MIEYITLSDLVKKVSQDAVEKGKEIFNTKKIREKYLNIFEIIEIKCTLCQGHYDFSFSDFYFIFVCCVEASK